MSINRPFRRRDDVRWPRSVGTVAQVADTGLVVLGPAAGTGVLAGNTGNTRSLDTFEPVAEVAAGMAVPGPLADTSTTAAPGRLVRSVGAGDPARLPPLPAAAAHNPEIGRVVGSGGSVTASSPPGEVTVTQLVLTLPLDDSVAGTGETS